MKKIVLVACVATCVMYFTPLSVTAQVTEDDFFEIDSLAEEEDDFVEVDTLITEGGDDTLSTDSKKSEELTANELTRISKYIKQGYQFVDKDEEGAYILKQNKRYICINPWLSNDWLIKEAEKLEFIDISGCGATYGILSENLGKSAVYTQKGNVLIPETNGQLIEVIVNPFKNSEHTPYAYAIFKKDGDYYAVLSNGSSFELKMDVCSFGMMTIFGIKGNKVYCFTPESMDTPEYMFDINDDVQYEEGEILTELGFGRFDYMGLKKYANITPAVLVKKGNEYFVYPGGKKVMLKKEKDVENIKLSSSLSAVFSGFPKSGKKLVENILENSE